MSRRRSMPERRCLVAVVADLALLMQHKTPRVDVNDASPTSRRDTSAARVAPAARADANKHR